jgi:hypothetical protein
MKPDFASIYLLNPFSLVSFAILIVGAINFTRRSCYEQNESVDSGKGLQVFLVTLLAMTLFALAFTASVLFLLFELFRHSTFNDPQQRWNLGLALFLLGPLACFLLGVLCSLFVGSRVSRLFWRNGPPDGQAHPPEE